MDQNKKNKSFLVSVSIFVVVIIIAVIYTQKTSAIIGSKQSSKELQVVAQTDINSEGEVLPTEIILPVTWNDLGKQMIKEGVIDQKKFEAIYAGRGGISSEDKKLLYEINNKEIRMTEENSGMILNLFWALGLANKNEILDNGPMKDPRYGGAGNFASTGGWTLAKGNAMDHYSMHKFMTLTPEQQALVEIVSKNIFRPCCGNSTYFPDCNHGMAMLGLLELMASRGVSEEMMYKVALQVNSYWFPDTYLTIAKYMEMKGISWDKVDPKEVLGANYSSGSGYRSIASQVKSTGQEHQGGSGCGVDSGQPTAPQRQQSGCDVGGQPAVAPQRQQSGCGV